MFIRLIIAQYKQSYPGQYMPNVMDAWDEFTLDDNHQGYREALEKHLARVGEDYEAVRELDVVIPDDVIQGLFEVPEITPTFRPVVTEPESES